MSDNIYKKAAKNKVRFNTEKGNLTTEQLFDLKLNDLDKLAVKLDEEAKESSTKSFLVEKTSENKEIKLKLDIALDVLQTKMDAKERARKRAERIAEKKEHNRKVKSVMEDKELEKLKDKSLEELEEMIE